MKPRTEPRRSHVPQVLREKTTALIKSVMSDYHDDLTQAKLKTDVLFVSIDDDDAEGAALNEGGFPTLARVKTQNIAARVLGMGDVLIEIDADGFDDLEPEQRIALLDHQLEHVELKLDKNGDVRRDSADRPMVSIRKHDIQIGFFSGVAARHGAASMEVYAAKRLIANHGRELQMDLFLEPPKKGKGNPDPEELDRERARQDVLDMRKDSELTAQEELETDLDRALEVLKGTKRGSSATIQRRLKISPTRTAVLMEELEKRGVLGPPEGSGGARAILDLGALRPANEPADDAATGS